MVRRHALSLCALAAALAGSACAHVAATPVDRNARGGVIELEGGYDAAFPRAVVLMEDHCGGPFSVLDEREGRVSYRCGVTAGDAIEDELPPSLAAAHARSRY